MSEQPLFYRMCIKKKRYASESQAMKIAEKVYAERQIKLRAYPCPYCGKWHLTKEIDENYMNKDLHKYRKL